MSESLRDALALGAGLLFPLAFAPFGWWPLALLAIAVLFYCWHGVGAGRSAWRGFLFGFGMFGVGVSWVYVSIHTFGNMSVGMSVLTVILFAALMALYAALAGFIQGHLSGASLPVKLLLLQPTLWILAEWLRGWLFSGFPWLNVGYAMLDTPLAGFAPVGGMYGVGLAATLTAGALVLIALKLQILPVFATVLLLWFGGGVLQGLQWFEPNGAPVKVALVQANISIGTKWNPDAKQGILDGYIERSLEVEGAQLILWPEASVPGYLDRLPEEFWQLLGDHPADFLFGVLERRNEGGSVKLYNSIVGAGATIGHYRKQHLVPFGEFFPLQSIFGWLFETLQIPMSDFAAWPSPQPPLELAGQAIAPSICYEDAFPEESRRNIPASTLLANISEDAWFGNSLAPHQRLQMARFRSLESGRPMLRASNSGLSSIIDAKGEVGAIAPQFEPYVLEGEVQPTGGLTVYVRFGNTPVILLSLMLFTLGMLLPRKRSRKRISE